MVSVTNSVEWSVTIGPLIWDCQPGDNSEPAHATWPRSVYQVVSDSFESDSYAAAQLQRWTSPSGRWFPLRSRWRPGRVRRAEVDGKLQPTAAATAYLKG